MTTFVVLAHGDPSTFNFLVRLLEPHQVVAHVDSRTPLRDYVAADHVRYVDDRLDVHWGGFSVVEATVRAYRLALQSTLPNDYVVLLSGQCVPVRPISELVAFLASSNSAQFCRAARLLDGVEKNERRVARRWDFDRFDARVDGLRKFVNASGRRLDSWLRRGPSRDALALLDPVAGSQWTAFTAECLDSLINGPDFSVAKQLLGHALAPDEIFFHSLFNASGWREDAIAPILASKGDLRTKDFANLHFIDVSLTAYLEEAELRAAAGRGAFFARKVDIGAMPELAGVVSELCSDLGPTTA